MINSLYSDIGWLPNPAETNKSFKDGASEQEDSPAETEPQTKKGRKSKEERAAEKSKKHEEKKEKKKGNKSILLPMQFEFFYL